MIVEMRKIQIIGPKGLLDECIKALHSLAVVHIETIPAGSDTEAFLQRMPMEKEKHREKEDLEKASERLKNLLFLLKPTRPCRTLRVGPDEIHRLLDRVFRVEVKVKALRAKKDELAEGLSAVGKYEKLLRGFAPIVSRLGGLKNFEIVGLTIEKTREDIAGLLASEVKRITGGGCEIHVKDLDEAVLGVVLTYPRRFDSEIRYLLSGKSISEIRLPDEYSALTLVDALKVMMRKKTEIPRRIGAIEKDLERISNEWYGAAAGLARAVNDALDEIGVMAYAAQTRFAFVIEGWVPAGLLENLNERLSSLFGDRILLREIEVGEMETGRIPIFIRNPRFLKPFEVFLTALPPPKYGSVDPTPFIALFFPAFFGLIVGDIGYGAVIFALSNYLRRRLRENAILSDICYVLAISGFSAIIFGFLFGEFFGDLGERFGLHPVLFHRAEALKTMILLTLGVGAGHVILGVIIGLVNFIYRGMVKEAGAKLLYLVLIMSFLAVMGIFFDYLPRMLLKPGILTLVAALVFLAVLEGVMGPLEFIKAIGNILSYLRIMAVGTASVVMAIVANKMGSRSEDVLAGIMVAGLIHLLNIILSVLSPSIQSMRLHYVEFFSKFYKGGGRKYVPFKKG